MPVSGPYELLKPFLWLALFAFLLGFAGYVAIGGADVARAAAATVLHPATHTSGPAYDGNPERHI
jgi:hypothetical protein